MYHLFVFDGLRRKTMNEEFLCFIWANRLMDGELSTTTGEPVDVFFPGERNRDGGPDFMNARIRIDGTLWAGNVEVHVQSGDWFRHNHHKDKTYENVILHVVYQTEPEKPSAMPTAMPTLVLDGCIPAVVFEKYRALEENRTWIPCARQLPAMDPFLFREWSPGLAVERLKNKSAKGRELWERNRYDWDETFYQGLSGSLGLKINTLPFELLSANLPLKVIRKQGGNTFPLEALAFGVAGMLEGDFSDSYPNLLKKEYSHLKQKFGLHSIEPSLWKFLRLRPSSFPTLRLAFWASLLPKLDELFAIAISLANGKELRKEFAVKANDYWADHYMFDKVSPGKSTVLGETAIDMMILNFVAPFLFLYCEEKDNYLLREHALAILEQLPGESNAKINSWKELGMPVENALHSQALLQLKSNYCDKKRCLSCRIGVKLLRGERK